MEFIIPKEGFKPREKISCVYMITNNLNGKRYIGQTTNYRKRISDYRNAEKRDLNHPIYRIIKENGSDNFTMEILQTCSPKALTRLENFYIKKYDTTNPEKGFNLLIGNGKNNTSASRKRKSLSHMGLKSSNDSKRKRSNMILAIKNNILIVSESGKLFGDYIHKSKDYIKNCLRQPSKVDGYRLYYDDYQKRQEIRLKMYGKRSIRDRQYIELLDFLDEIENEGVETIYSFYDVYYLSYDNMNSKNEPFLEKMGRDYFAG